MTTRSKHVYRTLKTPAALRTMERFSEISEATMNLFIKNGIVAVALLVIILAFALYVYLFRGPLLSEYFAAAERKETDKDLPVADTTKTA